METSLVQPSGLRVTTPTDRQVRVERIFAAPVDRVWKAFTDRSLLPKWWGRGNQVDVERFEFENGGHWRFVEHAPEGPQGFEGRFRVIEPMKRIAQTFEWDGMPGHPCVEEVRFEDAGGGQTRVVTTTTFFTTEERDGMLQSGMTEGMEQSYAALERILASR